MLKMSCECWKNLVFEMGMLYAIGSMCHGSHHTTSHVNYTGYTNGIVNNTLYEIENDDDISVLDRKQALCAVWFIR